MDFVVVGFGLGAVMMLAGFALRDLGPWLFGSNVAADSLPEFEAVKTTIRKQTLSSIGAGIATAGTGLALVTFAALIARTEDDLGTIVVGMSLALAAVGVGAWTYDAIRRYRAAMEMVSHQEQAVHARLRPAPRPTSARATPPVSTLPAAEQVAEKNASDESERSEIEAGSGDITAVIEPDATDDLAESEDFSPITDDAANFASPVTTVEPTVAPDNEFDFEDADFDAWAADDESDENEPASEPEQKNDLFSAMSARWNQTTKPASAPNANVADPDSANEVTESKSAAASPLRWPSFNRAGEKPREQPIQQDDALILPPLPDEHHDELIDESVRFDARPADNRQIPSWLFEDLETDLLGSGSDRPEDPVDQFRDSRPRPRGSALDRILAGDDGAEVDGDDEDEAPAKRRSDDDAD